MFFEGELDANHRDFAAVVCVELLEDGLQSLLC